MNAPVGAVRLNAESHREISILLQKERLRDSNKFHWESLLIISGRSHATESTIVQCLNGSVNHVEETEFWPIVAGLYD